MYKIILLLSLFLCSSQLSAQKVLALENAKKFKRLFFKQGDFIRIEANDSQARYSGYIESVNDSSVVLVKIVKMENEGDATNNVFRDYVPLSEIKAIYNGEKTYWHYFRNMYSGTAMVGGGVLILITSANTLLENQEPDASSILIATGILISGLAIRYIGRDKYKIGKRWKLRAMDLGDLKL
ncbi:MAG: hypothetical protein AAGD28_24420 [Bacteroidota bacterium]